MYKAAPGSPAAGQIGGLSKGGECHERRGD